MGKLENVDDLANENGQQFFYLNYVFMASFVGKTSLINVTLGQID